MPLRKVKLKDAKIGMVLIGLPYGHQNEMVQFRMMSPLNPFIGSLVLVEGTTWNEDGGTTPVELTFGCETSVLVLEE